VRLDTPLGGLLGLIERRIKKSAVTVSHGTVWFIRERKRDVDLHMWYRKKQGELDTMYGGYLPYKFEK
jgi:hypothetical protein